MYACIAAIVLHINKILGLGFTQSRTPSRGCLGNSDLLCSISLTTIVLCLESWQRERNYSSGWVDWLNIEVSEVKEQYWLHKATDPGLDSVSVYPETISASARVILLWLCTGNLWMCVQAGRHQLLQGLEFSFNEVLAKQSAYCVSTNWIKHRWNTLRSFSGPKIDLLRVTKPLKPLFQFNTNLCLNSVALMIDLGPNLEI